MIYVIYQDAISLRDMDNREIAHWDDDYGDWIVNDKFLKEYEHGYIDWTHTVGAISMKEAIKEHGQINK